MAKHLYVTEDNGGGFSLFAATVVIILAAVGLLYLAGAVPRNNIDEQSVAIYPQDRSTKGVIKPPDIGDTGIHTTVPHPNADSGMEVLPPRTPEGEPR